MTDQNEQFSQAVIRINTLGLADSKSGEAEETPSGRIWIKCPWGTEHTGDDVTGGIYSLSAELRACVRLYS